MTLEGKVIRAKVGVLELARHPGSANQRSHPHQSTFFTN